MSTIFSKIIRREIPADIVYEDDQCLAFRDIAPQAPLHVLLIPKREIASLTQVRSSDASLMGHLMTVAVRIAADFGLADDGYRVVINAGRNAGQAVDHLHLHILGGRHFSWPPG